jgi:hypothetical protein
MRGTATSRPVGTAIVALALAAMLGSAFHEAFHLLADPGHSDTHCTACQAAHGGGLPGAMPALLTAAVRLEPFVGGLATVAHRPRLHVAHPRGPPPSC